MRIDFTFEEKFLSLPPHGKIMTIILVLGIAVLFGYILGSYKIPDWVDCIKDAILEIKLKIIAKQYRDAYEDSYYPYKVYLKSYNTRVRSGPGKSYRHVGYTNRKMVIIAEEYIDNDGRVWGKIEVANRNVGWIDLKSIVRKVEYC